MDENAIEQLSKRIAQALDETHPGALHIIASELRSAQAEAPAPDLDAIEETIKMNDWCACREYLAGTPHDYSLTVAPVETDELTLAIEEARKSCQCLYLAVEESIARDVQTKVNTVVGLLERRLRAGPPVGSWPWALEQLKAGKQVKRRDFKHPLCEDVGFVMEMCSSGDPLGHYEPEISDFEATDWQLAESE